MTKAILYTGDMQSTWNEKADKSYPSLNENMSADVVIVGGGMAGILSAYFLAGAGKKVVLLEKGVIGGGATKHTTAFITQAIDTSLHDLIKMFGEDYARLVWQSGATAIDTIQKIVEQENIQCDFERCSAYIYAGTENEFRQLVAEHAAAQHLGTKTKLVRDGKLPFKAAGYLELSHQAKFHPLKFLYEVADKAVNAGVHIFEHTEVVKVSDEGKIEVIADNGSVIKADDVIIATYLPFNNPKATHFKKGMYRSYVLQAHLPHTDLEEAIYWDQANPYNYFRVDKDGAGKRIILGGADHRVEIPIKPDKNFHALEERLKEIAAGAPYTITGKWYGPILESSDGLPLIGAYLPHRYLATAFSGNGMTYSVVSALLFRDLISGQTNALAHVYDPTRKFTTYRLYKKGVDYVGRFFGGVVRNLFS